MTGTTYIHTISKRILFKANHGGLVSSQGTDIRTINGGRDTRHGRGVCWLLGVDV